MEVGNRARIFARNRRRRRLLQKKDFYF